MICPCCQIEHDLAVMFPIQNVYKCFDCIEAERIDRRDGWNAVKTTQVNDINTKLGELDAIAVLDRNAMLEKLNELIECVLQMKYYCERD